MREGLKSGLRGISNNKLSGLRFGLQSGLTGIEGNPRLLCAETIAWLAQLATPPSRGWVKALDDFIRTLKADGNWQYLDRLWIFATEQRAHALVSIKNPLGLYAPWPTNMTEVPYGGNMTWTMLQGFSGDGLSYLNTNFNASTQGVGYTRYAASMGICINNSSNLVIVQPVYDMGCFYGGVAYECLLICRGDTGKDSFRINCGNSVDATSIKQPGCYIGIRKNVNVTLGYYNGSLYNTDTLSDSAAGLVNLPFFICTLNNEGAPFLSSKRQYGMAFYGGAGLNATTFYAAFQTFRNAVGF